MLVDSCALANFWFSGKSNAQSAQDICLVFIRAWQVNDTFTMMCLIKISQPSQCDQGVIRGDGMRIILCGGKDSSQASFKMADNL